MRDIEKYKKALEENKAYHIDIDDTIFETDENYNVISPIQPVIDKINKLYDEECYIIINTSRGYITGIDWRELTEKQLEEFGVKYHELLFTKPAASYYLDDKNIESL